MGLDVGGCCRLSSRAFGWGLTLASACRFACSSSKCSHCSGAWGFPTFSSNLPSLGARSHHLSVGDSGSDSRPLRASCMEDTQRCRYSLAPLPQCLRRGRGSGMDILRPDLVDLSARQRRPSHRATLDLGTHSRRASCVGLAGGPCTHMVARGVPLPRVFASANAKCLRTSDVTSPITENRTRLRRTNS